MNDAMPAWKESLKAQAEALLKQQQQNSRLREHRVLEQEFKNSGYELHFLDTPIQNPTIGK